ncbi:IS3 family transposase, partial [Shigella flexneri]|nr:IS3 family transposase [Shigella flexneri]
HQRRSSDGNESSRENGERQRDTSGQDSREREAQHRAGTSGGINRETEQDVKQGAVERRYGIDLPSSPEERQTDKGSSNRANETRQIARMK